MKTKSLLLILFILAIPALAVLLKGFFRSSDRTQVASAEEFLWKINLNKAQAAELRLLPGIGPARAKAILQRRKECGGKFLSWEDLRKVSGIGVQTLEEIRKFAVLEEGKASDYNLRDANSPSKTK